MKKDEERQDPCFKKYHVSVSALAFATLCNGGWNYQ